MEPNRLLLPTMQLDRATPKEVVVEALGLVADADLARDAAKDGMLRLVAPRVAAGAALQRPAKHASPRASTVAAAIVHLLLLLCLYCFLLLRVVGSRFILLLCWAVEGPRFD